MINYNQIKKLHIELSSHCNAACPNCPRNFYGGPRLSWVPLTQIRFEEFKKGFPAVFIKQLGDILFCGNYGDPSLAQDLIEICEYIKASNPEIIVHINTNGGTRTPQFWAKLAKALPASHRVNFSVDGLEDTNHIYRKNVEWKKLIENIKAFISAGGIASWDFLIFKHNEHQIQEAKELATQMGFRDFFSKKALGFYSQGHSASMPVLKENLELDYHIFPPELDQHKNKDVIENEKLESYWVPNYSTENLYLKDMSHFKHYEVDAAFEKKANSCKINCHTIKNKEIYVSSEGLVFPCCFIGSQFYLPNNNNFEVSQIQTLYKDLGKEKHSILSRSLKDIIEDSWFQNTFSKSWEKPGIKEGRLSICSSFCGDSFHTLETISHDKVQDL